MPLDCLNTSATYVINTAYVGPANVSSDILEYASEFQGIRNEMLSG